ncbi:DUF2946 family protein [Magnetospira sp. QH-2]|uniref:DUF2946 family protein n=1 Tax=Magnetospira sp. (strain QH-2) TaxID=1288970 RepID=UPI0003E80E9F|nr:DUF2946 family protein [Magnetospira sp. QH-2]CCQ75740.1 conserved protein of unknown function [Magnetospira sp. QH-2]
MSKHGTHRGDRHRIAAWFTTWAFMVQVLVPFAMGIPVADAANGPSYLVICKAFGPPEIQPTGNPPTENRADLSDCPVCTTVAFSGDLVVPDRIPFPAVSQQATAGSSLWAETPKSSPRGARPPVRGPPAVF